MQKAKKVLTCKTCGEDFYSDQNKPGYINVCYDCTTEDVEKLGGNMIYEHKTAPGLEIKPISKARGFAKMTKRFGAGVTCSLTTSREAQVSRDWTGRNLA